MSPFNLKLTAFHKTHNTYFCFSFDERNPHVFFTNAFASCTGSVLAQACDASDSSIWKEENVVWRKRERRNLTSVEVKKIKNKNQLLYSR